jgi:MtN3 and saliva related transmembrane protein
MSLVEIIGVLAATFTTAAFLPQAAKVLRTRETAAISLVMYALFTAGVVFWLCYGLLTAQWPIIIANAITLVFALVILGMKLGEKGRNRGSSR